MKKQNLLSRMLLLCALVAGSGSVWALNFVKVTSTGDITDGQYLIVYEGDETHDPKIFNGALTTLDAAFNNIDVTTDEISAGSISATAEKLAASFTINKTNGTIESASGHKIGVSSYGNGLKQDGSASYASHSFAIEEGSAIISIYNATWNKGKAGTMILQYNYNVNDQRFRYYKEGSQHDIQLYKLNGSVTTIPVEISAVGWSTLSIQYPLDFTSAGANAYMVTDASGDALTLAQVTGTIPANTGLLISGSGSVNIPVVASSTTSTTGNLLVKGIGESITDAKKYVMVARGGKAVFAPTGSGTAAAKVLPGKAYLDLTGVSARDFYILDDSETTGIESVSSETKGFFDGEFYNLSGQRVTKPTKGLYIVNGKKVVIK